MRKVCGKDAAKQLLSLCQGSQSVAEITCEFRTLAAESGWNDEALQGAFRNELTETLKDELVSREEPDGLDELISFTICIDNRLHKRWRERGGRVACPITSASVPCSPSPIASHLQACSYPEPMQLSRTRLSPEERQRCIGTTSCLYCGQVGHLVSTCSLSPAKEGARQ